MSSFHEREGHSARAISGVSDRYFGGSGEHLFSHGSTRDGQASRLRFPESLRVVARPAVTVRKLQSQ